MYITNALPVVRITYARDMLHQLTVSRWENLTALYKEPAVHRLCSCSAKSEEKAVELKQRHVCDIKISPVPL